MKTKNGSVACEALARELNLAIERWELHTRRLDGAARRVRRATAPGAPQHKESLRRMTENIREGISELFSVVLTLVEDGGRVDALVKARALLDCADDSRR